MSHVLFTTKSQVQYHKELCHPTAWYQHVWPSSAAKHCQIQVADIDLLGFQLPVFMVAVCASSLHYGQCTSYDKPTTGSHYEYSVIGAVTSRLC